MDYINLLSVKNNITLLNITETIVIMFTNNLVKVIAVALHTML